MKRVMIQVDPKVWKRVKIKAAHAEISVPAYVRQAIEQALTEEKDKTNDRAA